MDKNLDSGRCFWGPSNQERVTNAYFVNRLVLYNPAKSQISKSSVIDAPFRLE